MRSEIRFAVSGTATQCVIPCFEGEEVKILSGRAVFAGAGVPVELGVQIVIQNQPFSQSSIVLGIGDGFFSFGPGLSNDDRFLATIDPVTGDVSYSQVKETEQVSIIDFWSEYPITINLIGAANASVAAGWIVAYLARKREKVYKERERRG